jgi:hypothetical protein
MAWDLQAEIAWEADLVHSGAVLKDIKLTQIQ